MYDYIAGSARTLTPPAGGTDLNLLCFCILISMADNMHVDVAVYRLGGR